jgi:hypothetical protein
MAVEERDEAARTGREREVSAGYEARGAATFGDKMTTVQLEARNAAGRFKIRTKAKEER